MSVRRVRELKSYFHSTVRKQRKQSVWSSDDFILAIQSWSQFIEWCHSHLEWVLWPPRTQSRNSLMGRPRGLSCRSFWMLSSWKAVLTITIPYTVSFRLYVYKVKHTCSNSVCSYHVKHQTCKYDDEVSEAEQERISSVILWVLNAMRKHHYQKKFWKERAYFIL